MAIPSTSMSAGIPATFSGDSSFPDLRVEPHHWHPAPNIYTPRKFMHAGAVLLESVILQLGPDPASARSSREIFLESLRSSLSHEGRESTLPLSDWNHDSPSAITRQALRVGRALYSYAKDYSQAALGDPELAVDSPCEGHKWIPPAGILLRSSRSSYRQMMIFNEWLHQITCLRDFLLAFENFEEVPIPQVHSHQRGMRPMELYHAPVLGLAQLNNLTSGHLFEIAKVLTAPGLQSGGFGFQYSEGLILPEAIVGDARSIFMRYVPAKIDPTWQGVVLLDASRDGRSVQDVVALLRDAVSKDVSDGSDPRDDKSALVLTGTLEDHTRVKIDFNHFVTALGAR